MRVKIIAVLFLFQMTAVPVFSQAPDTPGRPVHTYSIVARDSATGQLGVAVQSHWFSVGSLVAWAEAGVGAVATQSFVDPSYGPLGLELMRGGKSAELTLAALLRADPGREVRQVAMIDVNGNVAVHTGSRCIQAAGHIAGNGYSVQANLMLDDRVWGAMSAAYESAEGDLAERMLQALEAAEATGGDIRGSQSAAMLIVNGKSSGKRWQDVLLELRVEDHPDPVPELRRLVNVHRAYDHMNRGDLAIERGDEAQALLEYQTAENMFPDNLEMKFWHAVSLVNTGRLDEALPLFREVFRKDRNWLELVPRLLDTGLLQVDKTALRRIEMEAAK